MKIRTVLTAAAALLAIGATAAPAALASTSAARPAGHAQLVRPAVRIHPLVNYCDGGGGVCVTNKNGVISFGNPISGSAFTGNSNQDWIGIQSSACGDGHVHQSPGCPFAVGSGLNTMYNGDAIINMCLSQFHSDCAANNSPNQNGMITLQPNTATGTNWVVDNSHGVGMSRFVNKSRSDVLGSSACLFRDGTPGDVLVANLSCSAGGAQWAQFGN